MPVYLIITLFQNNFNKNNDILWFFNKICSLYMFYGTNKTTKIPFIKLLCNNFSLSPSHILHGVGLMIKATDFEDEDAVLWDPTGNQRARKFSLTNKHHSCFKTTYVQGNLNCKCLKNITKIYKILPPNFFLRVVIDFTSKGEPQILMKLRLHHLFFWGVLALKIFYMSELED